MRALKALGVAVVIMSMGAAPAGVPAGTYGRLADEVERQLREQVLAQFFPRVIDEQAGGFHQRFDRQWRRSPSGKFVVFQARGLYVASAVAAARPDLRQAYLPYVKHGLATLERMWDAERGGFYWGLGSDWKVSPEFEERKQLYGQVFAIYASAAAYKATQDPKALELAKKGFRWIEDHARDKANGGYFEALGRDGSRIGTPGDATTDFGGWPKGLKTSNSHLHVLEAYLELYQVWPDAEVRERLREMLLIFRDKIVLPGGSMGFDFEDDWRVRNETLSWGHDVEASHLTWSAAGALGMQGDEKIQRVTRRLLDKALAEGWDATRGGIYENEPGRTPDAVGPKQWWPQPENLLALAVMHERYGKETDRYLKAIELQLKCLQDEFTDKQFGGRPRGINRAGEYDYTKMDDWKEAYHDTRCLLAAADLLRRLGRSGAEGTTKP